MAKISQYPVITSLTGTESVLMDSGPPGNRQTVTATTATIAQSIQAIPGNAFLFGVNPVGGTDISAALQIALNSIPFVWLPPSTSGAAYILHDVTIPSGHTLFAPTATVQDAVGANWVIKCTGNNPGIIGLQVSSATNAPAAIIVDDAVGCYVDNVTIKNAQICVQLQSSSNGGNGTGCTNTRLSHIFCQTFSSTGINILPNCSNTLCANIIVDATLTAGTGGQIPKVGTTGYQISSGSSTVATQGHQFVNCIGQNIQNGFTFLNCTQAKLVNCEFRFLSGATFSLLGIAVFVDIMDCTSSFQGVVVGASGSSAGNRFAGLRTNQTGGIPSGGGSNWYSSAGFSAPFFDLDQASTATFTVDGDSWIASGSNGYTFTEAVQNNIRITGGWLLSLNSVSTVGSGSTVFIQVSGSASTQLAGTFTVPFNCIAYAARISATAGAAPGAAQTFTYTLFQNGAASAISGTTSGASATVATFTGANVSFSTGDRLGFQLVTSSGAASEIHYIQLQLIQASS